MDRDRHNTDELVLNLIVKGLENVHADVHGIRGQIRGDIAALSAKIDKLTPSGDVVTESDKALMAASIVRLQALSAKAKALDEMTS
jgi:hypothetical protein